jgi:membrane protein DedA with SNARE-associated domain
MWQVILKVVSVYFSCMVKFILGPLGGYAAGLPLVATILVTVAGMMTVVFLFTFFGNWIRDKVFSRLFKKRKKFSQGNRRFVGIWKKYGLVGVAALTPVILTPIGGTLLAVSSGSPKEKIIFYMFISASAWSIVFSCALYFFGSEVLKYLPEFAK